MAAQTILNVVAHSRSQDTNFMQTVIYHTNLFYDLGSLHVFVNTYLVWLIDPWGRVESGYNLFLYYCVKNGRPSTMQWL